MFCYFVDILPVSGIHGNNSTIVSWMCQVFLAACVTNNYLIDANMGTDTLLCHNAAMSLVYAIDGCLLTGCTHQQGTGWRYRR